jgi:hypothetical protein
LHTTAWRLAFVADFGTRNFHLKTKFDMENKTSINHKNGNDANRLLAAVDFNSPENQNRDKAIIGYGPVLKCKCEMPAKIHGKNLCWRCKRSLS